MLNTPVGIPVNSVYGVLTMLLKLLQKKDCTHIVLAQDSKVKSFRSDIYDEYKANRQEPPDELKPQFKIIDEVIDCMGISRIRVEGFEADDIISTLVHKYKDTFDNIYIVSSDKDLFQLVGDNIYLLDTMKEIQYGKDEVKEKMGVGPSQIVDFLSLVGDSSDNVPGVKGIGEKGAIKLLEEYGSLEEILKSVSTVKNSKIQNALKNYSSDALLSRKLVTLKNDISLDINPDTMKSPNYINASLKNILVNLGFKSLLAKLYSENQKASVSDINQNSTLVSQTNNEEIKTVTLIDINELLKRNKGSSASIFDEGFSLYLYLESEGIFEFSNDEKDSCVYQLLRLEYKLYVWDAKKYAKDIKNVSLEYFKNFFDIKLASFTLNTESANSLEIMCEKYLSSIDMSSSSAKVKSIYQIGKILDKNLEEEGLKVIFKTIDLPMLYVLATMEEAGILIDTSFFKKLSSDFTNELNLIEKEIIKSCNSSINLKSPKQVGILLFEKLQLPSLKKTKTGYSTDSSVLHKLESMKLSPVPGLILKFREYDKLLSTYVDSLPTLIHEDGRLHTTFNLTVAATGRLTSENPNLQNIPIKTERGKLLRKGFVSSNNRTLISADYSQVELRILAHYCQDPAMLEAFKHDKDIHRQTASEVFGIRADNITDEQRSYAKAINFGLIYGQSSFGLAEVLNITQGEAKGFIEKYFQRFSAVKIYLDSLKEFCEKNGYAQTYLGRKRYLPDIKSTNRLIKAQADRMAINTPIQGTAADLMKLSMVELYQKLDLKFPTSKLLLQVHDELIIECDDSDILDVAKLVKQVMESSMALTVPLKVDVSRGKNWLDMEEIDF